MSKSVGLVQSVLDVYLAKAHQPVVEGKSSKIYCPDHTVS